MSDPDTQSYDLDPIDAPPELPGSVRVGLGIEETLDSIAADMFVQSSNCVNEFGDFHLALSHGLIQERLFMKLMVDPKYRSMPWGRTHLWSVCESAVPPGHDEHSMTHWEQIVVDAGGVPREQLHPMQAHLPSGATRYIQELTEHLEWRERGHDRLDFVLLGADLSLIAGVDDPADQLVSFLACQTKLVMTRRILNAARFIGVVGVGADGRNMVDSLVESNQSEQIGLSPSSGVMRWYLDGYACRHTQELVGEENSEHEQ